MCGDDAPAALWLTGRSELPILYLQLRLLLLEDANIGNSNVNFSAAHANNELVLRDWLP